MFDFPLEDFISEFGTGVEVIRYTNTYNPDPELLVAGGSTSFTVVLTAIRFIENPSGVRSNNSVIQDNYGQQTAPGYDCHFFDGDDIQPGDVLRFNPGNLKKITSFDSSLDTVQVTLQSAENTGFTNHKLFKGILGR